VTPGPTLGEAANPRVGANILSPCSLSEFLYVGIPKRQCSTADMWRPTIRADVVMLTEPLLLRGGRYCSAGIAGPEAVMTTFPEPIGRRASGMRRDSVSASLHHHFTI
jgi:hypothetical protein